MIQSIAIQAYFARMKNFFNRQGFDSSLKVVYGADAEGPQRLLDQDLANKDMDKKSTTTKDTTRSNPYTYLFWTRDSLTNVIRRSIKLRDGVYASGKGKFKKTVSAYFNMACSFVSNKAELIEDFSEAFASEYQNLHNIPINLKFAYSDRNPVASGGFDTDGLNCTIIQNLGTEELVSFRQGDLFSYAWGVSIYLNFVSEFADMPATPLEGLVVDLYNPAGIPLASMGISGKPEWTTHTAMDGTILDVPAKPFMYFDKP